jgi:hypothetical protein
MPVRENVGRIEKLFVTEAADRALLPIRSQDSLPEQLLVHALPRESRHVCAPTLVSSVRDGMIGHQHQTAIVHRYSEGQCFRIVTDDEHWPVWHVPTRHHTEQINQWRLPAHRKSEPSIIPVRRIGPPVSVPQHAPFVHAIVVGAVAPFDHRHRCDAERDFCKNCWLEDSLRSQEWHSMTLEFESAREGFPRNDLTVEIRLQLKESKSGKADTTVEIVLSHETPSRCAT